MSLGLCILWLYIYVKVDPDNISLLSQQRIGCFNCGFYVVNLVFSLVGPR